MWLIFVTHILFPWGSAGLVSWGLWSNPGFFFFPAALGLCCSVQAFSSCSERGLLFVVVRRLLIVVASLVAENGT